LYYFSSHLLIFIADKYAEVPPAHAHLHISSPARQLGSLFSLKYATIPDIAAA